MTRSRFASRAPRELGFLNRTEQLRLIGSHVALLGDDPGHLQVFEVIGIGGVGKTRLLNEVQRRVAERDTVGHLLWVSLEGEAAATETAPLRVVREQLQFDCLLFDTALVTYWHATGQAFDVPASSRLARSLVFKSLDVGRSALAVPLPLTFAADLYHAVNRRVARVQHYKREEFAGIDDLRMKPSELRERLPHYLGLDVVRRLQVMGKSLVVFYDAYDRQAPGTLTSSAPWLREFIGTVDRGVHIIATREPIRWTEADWREVVQSVVVGDLPLEESRELIRGRLGAVSPEVEDRLVSGSRQIPFFLAAALDAYQIRAEAGQPVNASDLPDTPDAAVAYLLEHLPADQRVAAMALAMVQVFDADLYSQLIFALHLSVSVLAFEEFVAWFFVEEVSHGVYKTHDLLTEFVRTSLDHRKVKEATLDAATRGLVQRCVAARSGASQAVLPLFAALLTAWTSVPAVPVASVEALVDAGYFLYDLGHWNELAAMARHPRADAQHAVALVLSFFGALAARRTSGVAEALDRFEEIEPALAGLGRHRRSAELELAYLSELSGNYAAARGQFELLAGSAIPFDPSDRTHLRSRLCHADMLTMDGVFEPASRLLLETYEIVGSGSPLDWAELVRHRAHIFRFSFLKELATDLYLAAARVAVDAPALSGKLQTNLAEMWCWSDPDRALAAADLSSDVNSRLGNRIELAKCDAARAIALAKRGDLAEARSAASRARAVSQGVGYAAGTAFALQAATIVETLAGDYVAASGKLRGLTQVTERLGTYGFLRVVPTLLLGDRALVGVPPEVAWLRADEFVDRLRECFPGRLAG